MTGWLGIALWLVAGCIHDELVRCGDGRECPIGTACDDLHATCVLPAQLTACTSTPDGRPCDGFAGICDRGVCLPGCGDGVRSSTEDCDDGNFASHDGCSSACLIEQASWERWQNPTPWRARSQHAAAFDA
ncbi:MAG TPA: DUF4215 domain-containing protein, partial [Kofleriaceae bacterium]|nr:DUF4215 domain-containing protein [Kofleriaceae bacterium]